MQKFTRKIAYSPDYIKTFDDAGMAQLGHLNAITSAIESGTLRSTGSESLQSISGSISPSAIATIINAGGGIGSPTNNITLVPAVTNKYYIFSHAVIKVNTLSTASSFSMFFGTPDTFGNGQYVAFASVDNGSDKALSCILHIPPYSWVRVDSTTTPFSSLPLAITFTSGIVPYVPLTSALKYTVFYYVVTI